MAENKPTKTHEPKDTADEVVKATNAKTEAKASDVTETPATPSPTQAELDAIREDAFGKRRRDVKATKSAGYETR